jgi:hypothetical protein
MDHIEIPIENLSQGLERGPARQVRGKRGIPAALQATDLHPWVDREWRRRDARRKQAERIGAMDHFYLVSARCQQIGELGNEHGVASEVLGRKECSQQAEAHAFDQLLR